MHYRYVASARDYRALRRNSSSGMHHLSPIRSDRQSSSMRPPSPRMLSWSPFVPGEDVQMPSQTDRRARRTRPTLKSGGSSDRHRRVARAYGSLMLGLFLVSMLSEAGVSLRQLPQSSHCRRRQKQRCGWGLASGQETVRLGSRPSRASDIERASTRGLAHRKSLHLIIISERRVTPLGKSYLGRLHVRRSLRWHRGRTCFPGFAVWGPGGGCGCHHRYGTCIEHQQVRQRAKA